MAIFTAKDAEVFLPRNIADGMVKNVREGSTVAKLAAREPMRFGKTDIIVFNEAPKAEFVEAGAKKSASDVELTAVTATPKKAQVTMRFDQEVQWASEDYQLGILSELASEGQLALSRALDLGVYHRVNPLTGEPISAWTNYLTATDKAVELTEGVDADAAVREAVGLIMNDAKAAPVTGIALDPKLSWALANLTGKTANGQSDGVQRYPQLGFGADVTDFLGLRAAQSNTVSGVPEAKDTGVRGIVGDFDNGIRWGVQRELPVEIIQFGDPDGQGDLKRQNQIALRLEIVYGWHVFADRFAVVKTAAAGE